MANERKSQDQLLKELEEAKFKVIIGAYYSHYKHPGEKRYQVIDVAIYEDTEEVCVIYKSLTMNALWIRTLVNFLSEVDLGDEKIARFSKI